ncbi:MAG: pyruvate dehydrogenase complex dihydrolipoamide acetyltransferase [Gemmatimonadetes bacterium]|nr:pyruvate dehydrogenase complex dihydrolipoamide acetyltransferase [Gemmatimonadota bacterium]
MATKVHMEALSPTMEEGQVVRWLKEVGDPVGQGDILAEIETDKATMELVARGEGLLRRILVAAGGTAPVGEVIAIIAAEGEEVEAAPDAGPTGSEATAERAADSSQGEREAESGGSEDPAAPSTTARRGAAGRVRASPLSKRLALQLGVEIESLEGTGPGGRVVRRDVEAAAEARAAQEERDAGPGPVSGAALHPEEEFEDVPLTQMRKTVARRLAESLGPVPHFYLTVDVDMTRALAARARVNEILSRNGGKASVNDVIIKAAAVALTRHPECNAWWRGSSIRRFNRVHMGVAVAVPDGLITPVIRDAHMKGLDAISREVRELAARAREKKLQPHEYTGSTFSISNLGMFGIEEFTGVINPPEAGILAVGAVEERPVAFAGEVLLRSRMRITMSCDHRVIDGAQGARFLATLKSYLEEPLAILI